MTAEPQNNILERAKAALEDVSAATTAEQPDWEVIALQALLLAKLSVEHAHLLDDDENAGEFVRGHIRAASAKGPLSQRLRDAADAITELNSMSGYDADAAQRAAVSAKFLRDEADELEKP